MLKYWTPHAEYQQSVTDAASHLGASQFKKLLSHADSLAKLTSMNLDPVGQHLLPYYSDTGRPAKNQPEIFRSLTLMMDQGVFGITEWVAELASDDLLALMIGCRPDSLPPLGSYYDFIDRLWLRNQKLEKSGRKDLFPHNKNWKEWDIQPFIDLNSNRGRPKSIPDNIVIDEDGTPLCHAGHRMVPKGSCPGRSRYK